MGRMGATGDERLINPIDSTPRIKGFWGLRLINSIYGQAGWHGDCMAATFIPIMAASWVGMDYARSDWGIPSWIYRSSDCG